MLTRDLLRYRVYRGEVKPKFIDANDPALLAHAEALLQTVHRAAAENQPRVQVEEALAACPGAEGDLLLARGLRKLVADACRYSDPDPDAPALRARLFTQGTAILRELPEGATRTEFIARLARACGGSEQIYSDLPAERLLLAVKPFDAADLLHRYNMAQVQGLLLVCKRLGVRAAPGAGALRQVRRVLRHLKFCRLVAAVQKQSDGAWDMDITGPADLFEHAKKYGLQLALFLPVVPVLAAYVLEADVEVRPGRVYKLTLTQDAPLVSPYVRRLGAAPPEMQHLVKGFKDTPWKLDPNVPPRSVGAKDMMLPDFSCVHESGRRVDVELFHRWHRHALLGRLRQLSMRPDDGVLLGIDKPLAASAPVIEALAAADAVPTFTFNSFPTVRKLRDTLC